MAVGRYVKKIASRTPGELVRKAVKRGRVGVTGGEPFMRRDALDFIAYVKGRGLCRGLSNN